MIGHYTINIPENFQIFEWFSEFDSNALRGGGGGVEGGGGGGEEGFLKGWIFPKGEQSPTHLL